MKSRQLNPNKELYEKLRGLSYTQLWEQEVARFDRATPEDRGKLVAVVRAVGSSVRLRDAQTKSPGRAWLRGLLQNPDKRFAATPSRPPETGRGDSRGIGSPHLARDSTLEREKKFASATLAKIGGTATLEQIRGRGTGDHFQQTEQKIKASLARAQQPSRVRLDKVLAEFRSLRIHLRGRKGLETIVRDEVQAQQSGKFRVVGMSSGLVSISPTAPFSLADVYALRCFGTAGFVLGTVNSADPERSAEALASLITSPLARRLLQTLTEGSIRYRLDFVSKGHQRGAVRLVANRAYAKCPEILNDPREACWTVAIHPVGSSFSVELCPSWPQDPRFTYRQDDVPAASHPPLAACMARLAGAFDNEIVWDPFCGSGLELIERALLGGVRQIFGSDQSAEAVDIAGRNLAAAHLAGIAATLGSCDFRKFNSLKGLSRNTATLVITNPL